MRIVLDSCVIRRWEPKDKPSLVRFGDNRRIWRNLTDMFPSPYTEADADAWLSSVNETQPCTHFAIEVERIAVGGVGIIPLEGVSRKTGQLGYWLGEPYWGQGIATAAAQAVVAHAFANLSLARLEAAVFAWNPASMRVLEKVGFMREGVLKNSVYKDGQLIDSVMYAITRDA